MFWWHHYSTVGMPPNTCSREEDTRWTVVIRFIRKGSSLSIDGEEMQKCVMATPISEHTALTQMTQTNLTKTPCRALLSKMRKSHKFKNIQTSNNFKICCRVCVKVGRARSCVSHTETETSGRCYRTPSLWNTRSRSRSPAVVIRVQLCSHSPSITCHLSCWFLISCSLQESP